MTPLPQHARLMRLATRRRSPALLLALPEPWPAVAGFGQPASLATDSLLDGAASLLNLIAALRPGARPTGITANNATGQALAGLAQAPVRRRQRGVLVAVQTIDRLQRPQPPADPGHRGDAVVAIDDGRPAVPAPWCVSPVPLVRCRLLHYRLTCCSTAVSRSPWCWLVSAGSVRTRCSGLGIAAACRPVERGGHRAQRPSLHVRRWTGAGARSWVNACTCWRVACLRVLGYRATCWCTRISGAPTGLVQLHVELPGDPETCSRATAAVQARWKTYHPQRVPARQVLAYPRHPDRQPTA